MTWWQILLLCWFAYILGFITAALMAAARDDELLREHNREAMRSAGLNDD
jgi:hypothetical protein